MRQVAGIVIMLYVGLAAATRVPVGGAAAMPLLQTFRWVVPVAHR